MARDIVAATELIVKVTLSMDEAVTRELEALKPDVVVADSVAYWGRLIAQKLGIPLEEVVKMSGLNPAKKYGFADRYPARQMIVCFGG